MYRTGKDLTVAHIPRTDVKLIRAGCQACHGRIGQRQPLVISDELRGARGSSHRRGVDGGIQPSAQRHGILRKQGSHRCGGLSVIQDVNAHPILSGRAHQESAACEVRCEDSGVGDLHALRDRDRLRRIDGINHVIVLIRACPADQRTVCTDIRAEGGQSVKFAFDAEQVI